MPVGVDDSAVHRLAAPRLVCRCAITTAAAISGVFCGAVRPPAHWRRDAPRVFADHSPHLVRNRLIGNRGNQWRRRGPVPPRASLPRLARAWSRCSGQPPVCLRRNVFPLRRRRTPRCVQRACGNPEVSRSSALRPRATAMICAKMDTTRSPRAGSAHPAPPASGCAAARSGDTTGTQPLERPALVDRDPQSADETGGCRPTRSPAGSSNFDRGCRPRSRCGRRVGRVQPPPATPHRASCRSPRPHR